MTKSSPSRHGRGFARLAHTLPPVVAAIFAVASPAHALAGPAGWTSQSATFDIPAQNLEASLLTFARQAGVQLVLNPKDVRSFTAPAVAGPFTPERALALLLGSRNLSAEWAGNRTLIIKRSARVRPIALQQSTQVPDAPAAAPAAAQSDDIADIVVTARRSSERLQDVPLAVSVVSGDQLQQRGITDVSQLQYVAPGLTIGSSGSGDRNELSYSIRGQALLYQQPNAAVVTYLEDVPVNTLARSVMFDLASVQVLKGPQGTLFGKNTTGGAVLFSAAKPNNSFGGEVAVRYGNYNDRESDGYINVPIVSDKVMARLAYNVGKRKGYTRDLTSGLDLDNENYVGVRFGLLIKPTDNISNYLMVNYYHDSTNGPGEVLDAVNPVGFAPFVFPGMFAELVAQQARGPRAIATSSDHFRTDDYLTLVDTFTWDITPSLTFKNIFGWSREKNSQGLDLDGTIFPVLDYLRQNRPNVFTETFSDEAQFSFTGIDNRLKLVGGYFGSYSRPRGEAGLFNNALGSPPLSRVNQYRVTGNSVYAQGSFEVAPGLKLNAGIRYNADKQTNIASIYGPAGRFAPAPDGCLVTGAPAGCLVERTGNYNHVSWLAGVDYKVTPDTLLYIVVRNGYRSGGLNGYIQLPEYVQYDPETVTDVEAGVKSRFRLGDVPIRLSADVFRGKYKGLQRSTSLIIDGIISTAFFNAGDAIVKGFEVEAEVRPVKELTLTGFWNYTDAKYSGPVSPLLGTFRGFTYTPKHQVGASATVTVPVAPEIGDISFAANYSYQSKVFYATNSFSDVPGYGLLNLRADWRSVMKSPVDLGLFMNNVTDATRKNWNSGFFENFGYNVVTYVPPRMYGVELRYHF